MTYRCERCGCRRRAILPAAPRGAYGAALFVAQAVLYDLFLCLLRWVTARAGVRVECPFSPWWHWAVAVPVGVLLPVGGVSAIHASLRFGESLILR